MAEISEREIENFSCWNNDIHGDSFNFSYCSLFPRGKGGWGENIVVTIHEYFVGGRELSFIGSDGSLMCTRRPVTDSGGDPTERIFIGPKFEEVVGRIRMNEPLHKDRMIVRWETPRYSIRTHYRMVVDAYSAFLCMKPEMFDWEEHRGNTKKPVSNDWNVINNIDFRFGNGNQFITVSSRKTGSTLEDTRLQFKLESGAENEILSRTSIWMLDGDKLVEKYEDDCILVKGDGHIPPYEVPLKKLQTLQTIMRIKIITGGISENLGYITDFRLSSDLRITGFPKFCEIKSLENADVSDPTKESNSFPRESQSENAVAALTKDLSCLYQDHNFSDFELRCGTVSFPTHRGILSARSPVLKAMLSGDMREAASGHVDFEDLDPHTLGRFLAYLYSGTRREDQGWEEASKLYYAADKYQVPSLKSECVAVLCASVSLENVCDILSLADRHQDEELRSVAHDFILKNFNEVLGSERWKKFMSFDPLLAVKTVTHFAENNYIKKSDSNSF